MSADNSNTVNAVRDAVYKSCLYKDEMDWDKWLNLCDDDFAYAITAYSPEIQNKMTYLSGNREDMRTMMDMLPKHNTDHSPLKRHCSVYAVEVDPETSTATAVSSVLVYQTLLDGVNCHVDAGESKVFLVGRYHDKFRITDDDVKFIEREVKLDTRRLDKGSHYPI